MRDAPNPSRVTILDVAHSAGVSAATACRALNGHPSCAAETRARVARVAEELGYKPDPVLSALVSHRDSKARPMAMCNLAMVSELMRSGSMYSTALWSSIRAEAEGRGYSIELYDPGSVTPAALARVLHARGVRGIIWGWLSDAKFSEGFPWAEFAHIGFLLPVVRPRINRVRDDEFRTVIDAAEAAFEHGYRRPGLALMTSPGSENDRFAMAAWLLVHAERGVERPVPVWRGDSQESAGEVASWFHVHRPDVVIGNTTVPFHVLRREGLAVPGDVDFLYLQRPKPEHPFTGFDCSEPEIARALINRLDAQLRRNEFGLVANPTTLLVKRRFLGWPQPAAAERASCRINP